MLNFTILNTRIKQLKRERRRWKIRSRIKGTAQKPRLVAFRSNRHLYLQAVDDDKGRIICAASDLRLKGKSKRTGTEIAAGIGRLMAECLKDKKITRAVFDRAGYKYHGNIKTMAQEVRKAGLII